MSRQANIVSFDAARRAATGTRAPRRGSGSAGRVLIGGDQSAVVDELPSFSVQRPRRGGAAGNNSRAGESFMSSIAASARDAARRGANPQPSWYRPDSFASDAGNDDVFARPAAARPTRFADDDFEGASDEALEEAMAARQRGPLGAFRSRRAEKRRERTKERADRAYFRQYEAGKGPDTSAAGPRAAVYKGEMGSSHKRSSRMQQQAAPATTGGRRRFRGSAEKGPFFTRAPFMGFAATMLCLAFGVAFLYGPAQQLYVDIRERDRLTAEYEAVMQRNSAIGKEVSALQTEDGIKDMARTQLGWVSEGEHAVSVSGLNHERESSFYGNILSEDIELPDTWYSGVLDPLFGVS